MASHSQTDWIRIFRDQKDWVISYGDRLHSITSDLTDSTSQFPSLIVLIGRRAKARALKEVFPENNHSRRRGQGIAALNLDSLTAYSNRPLLFADVDLEDAYVENNQLPSHGREIGRQRVEWMEEACELGLKDVVDTVLARLMFLFADLICVFVDDFDGTDEAISQVATWAQMGPASSLTRPRVIMVTSGELPDTNSVTRNVTRNLPNFHRSFSSIRVVDLLDTSKLSPVARHLVLKDALLNEADTARQARIDQQLFFSAAHLNAFFEGAFKHTASTNFKEFDFIRASRGDNQVGNDFHHHLGIFLNQCAGNEASMEFIVSFIASCIVLDSSPPGMHRRCSSFLLHSSLTAADFDPRSVFRALYRSQCYEAFLALSAKGTQPPDKWCKLIEERVAAISRELITSDTPAHKLHIQGLRSLRQDWSRFKTTRTCLFCLRRKPEHVLFCGHAVCDTCVCIFGQPSSDMEYLYHLSTCLLCQIDTELKVRLKPPTAGTRLLTMDGGGIRGSFSLEALKVLEQYRNLPYPLQDDFDFALGTSSGGLAILMWCRVFRSVRDCIKIFDRLGKRVFASRNNHRRSLFARILHFFASLLRDSRYGNLEMKACVRNAYGVNGRMFGAIESGVAGIKVAVTAITVSDSKLCILSNYNGAGARRKECGMFGIRAMHSLI